MALSTLANIVKNSTTFDLQSKMCGPKNIHNLNICSTLSYVFIHPNFTSTTTSEYYFTSQIPLNRHLYNNIVILIN